VVVLDGDGSADLADLPALLAPIAANEADLVIGDRTRRAAAGSLTAGQRAGNLLACSWISAYAARRGHPHRPRDLGPFRAARWGALMDLGLVDPTWGWNVEMHLKAVRVGLRIAEVPVAWHPRTAGTSKISGDLRGAARAGVRVLEACWRYA
jgi:hypothetical protein